MTSTSDMAIGLADFTILRPWWLLALLPCWALAWRLARKPRGRFGNWTNVVDAELLPHVVVAAHAGRGGALRMLPVLGLTLAIIALAGPALQGRSGIALRSDAMRVLVADLSPALSDARNGPPLVEALQIKLLDLLTRMPEGQTALIAYADEPYLVAPPTTDTATLRMLVAELAPDILPAAGDRPERALQMAAQLLAKSGAKTRDVLWLHAGGETAAPAVQTVAALRAEGMRVSLLRLSADAPARPPLHDAIVASGGLDVARRADDGDVSALVTHFEHDSALRAGQTATRSTPREFGPWLLAILLPFAALAFRRGLFALLAAVMLLPPPTAHAREFADWWLRPDQRAIQVLNRGAAETAASQFTDARWKAIAHYRAGNHAEAAALLEPFDDADSLYNRGNALARLQRLEEALQAYHAALQRRPDDPDILHNRDLVRELMKRPPPPPSGQGTPPAPRGNGSSSTSAPPPAQIARRDTHEQEAERLAQQWLRSVPDEPAGLLRRKLELEHRRRQSGELARPW